MWDTFVPYLDPIVKRLLKVLYPTCENTKQPKWYVQEQAIMTLAMIANASEATFAKVGSIHSIQMHGRGLKIPPF